MDDKESKSQIKNTPHETECFIRIQPRYLIANMNTPRINRTTPVT